MTSDQFIPILNRACEGEIAAMRAITTLQPVDGVGAKIYPPTYADGAYAFEDRMINGTVVKTVLLDSVQSQANRFEEALFFAYRSQSLQMPVFEMNVPGHETITSLTVPHRVHDAILRDSLWGGKPFRESEHGQRLVAARTWNAMPFFEFAPTVLLFGTWDSQSGGGVNTAKVARSLVSEIVGIDAVLGVRTSSRIDPLGIRLVREVVMKTEGSADMWHFVDPTADGKKSKKDSSKESGKPVRPSEINHGNVAPTIAAGGVTIREAVQTTVLSFTHRTTRPWIP